MAEFTLTNFAVPRLSARYKTLRVSSATQEMILVGLIMSLLQVVDGVLTMIGVRHFGSVIEGNPLVRAMIEMLGAIPALCLTKLFAIIVIVALCSLHRTVPWIGRALKGVMVVYLVAAIIPWSFLILSKVS